MLTEPLRSSDFSIVTFQADDEDDFDEKVNNWLRERKPDVEVFNMLYGYAGAESPTYSFALTLVYGNRPKSTGNA
ncbi:hypothetical protein ACFLV4_04220 [Chloroflexota bacterium]